MIDLLKHNPDQLAEFGTCGHGRSGEVDLEEPFPPPCVNKLLAFLPQLVADKSRHDTPMVKGCRPFGNRRTI